MSWTTEQILALAPDASSQKAGQGLARLAKWVSGSLGKAEQTVWGACQGSGSTPYQTQIDLSEPAFKCSCPSRKFPCKHGLGLFLIFAEQPASVPDAEPPAWVSDWIASRAAKAEKKAKKEEAADLPPDPKAEAKRAAQQAKTAAARASKVSAGVEEVELWLRDLMRRGLAAAQGQSYSFWETPAARMVDAQAPGIARRLREMAGIPNSGAGWQDRLLSRLGKLYLLLQAYRRLESLPEPVQADIRTLIGWTLKQEDLAAEPGVTDRWQVLGQRVIEEDRLRIQRTWLRGAVTGRMALVLTFAAYGQSLENTLVPGTEFEAELVYFPGNYPLRAAVRARQGEPVRIERVGGYADIKQTLQGYAQALARNPWLEEFPLLLDGATLLRHQDGWLLRDGPGAALPITPGFERGWEMLAVSGGHPVSLFGEWNGDVLLPLGLWSESAYHSL